MVVGYVSVSKDDQLLSVEAQCRELERWCVEQGLTLDEVTRMWASRVPRSWTSGLGFWRR